MLLKYYRNTLTIIILNKLLSAISIKKASYKSTTKIKKKSMKKFKDLIINSKNIACQKEALEVIRLYDL